MAFTDDELLATVREERRRSIGFGESDSGELTNSRQKALQYYKGDMPDVPAGDNRSRVVDSAIADAIETVLPDVLEIFVGGDDVATFIPQGEDDEEAAREESDYVTHVVMQENNGFLLLHTAFKDALLTRTGVFYVCWEDEDKVETRAAVPAELADAAPMIQAAREDMHGESLESEEQEDGSVNLNQTVKTGHCVVSSVAPEDFTVAFDTTTDLQATTYCAMRARPRVQDLIAQGLDAEKVRDLPSYVNRNDSMIEERDEAGENANRQDGSGGDLRVVEVRYHYVRKIQPPETKPRLWKVTTDGQETVLLDKEEVYRIPFAALTPYLNSHRFYGESVADKLFEIQRIKTALLRMFLDSGYFALNQRNYVDMTKANEFTISDLLRNAPGVPVRGNGEGAVTPIMAGQLGFDAMAALEYVSTMAEARSGIVRNAQGLNPDTLHDTASGAMQLIAAAQKRVRLIARIFAETGIKDLWLLVHFMLRSGYSDEHAPAKAKLGNAWKEVRPNTWQERAAMTIHVGVGSAGKEHELAIATQRLTMMQELVTLQGGLQGPLVDSNNAHAALDDWERAAGSKKADQFWSDPSDPNAPQPQPKPDPAMAKVQGQMQIEQAKVQAKTQGDAQAAQAQLQFEQAKHAAQLQQDAAHSQAQLQLQREKNAMEAQQKAEQAQAELQLRREIAAQELQLQREVAMLQAQHSHEQAMAKVSAGVQQPQVGGEPG